MMYEPETLDVAIGPGRRTLRIITHRTELGAPEAVTLALGFGGADGSPFHRPAWGDPLLTVPASAVPALRAALARLEGAS